MSICNVKTAVSASITIAAEPRLNIVQIRDGVSHAGLPRPALRFFGCTTGSRNIDTPGDPADGITVVAPHQEHFPARPTQAFSASISRLQPGRTLPTFR